MIFKNLFSGNSAGKSGERQVNGNNLPKAVAFVDYEHWYVSLIRNYGMKPNIKGWFDDLKERVNLTEAVFFADFSKKSLSDEISRIRSFSNKIIDTRSPNGNTKKDYTDFIILDNMYQKALAADDIDTFILFSGDGHFSSVTSFLKNFRQKNVGIYGVKDCFSRQLQSTASWCVTIPSDDDVYGMCNKHILDYLKQAEDMKSQALPTFEKTVEAVSALHKTDRQKVISAINKLVEDGVLSKRDITYKSSKAVQALFVDWNMVEASKLS